jgi:hypothetical protein
MTDKPKLDFVTMPFNPYSLGMILEFLSRFPPFAAFEVSPLVNAISFQLGTGSNLLASQNDEIIAYLGWIPTTVPVAKAWMRTGELLTPSDNGDAIAITVMATSDPAIMLSLIRTAKSRHSYTNVYWRRYFQDKRGERMRSLERRTTEA